MIFKDILFVFFLFLYLGFFWFLICFGKVFCLVLFGFYGILVFVGVIILVGIYV